MTVIKKEVLFKVYTDKPGWFIDEAYGKGLIASTIPDVFAIELGRNWSCEVRVIGAKDNIDNFKKYVSEKDYDVEIMNEKETPIYG